jgi:hypothetical protein
METVIKRNPRPRGILNLKVDEQNVDVELPQEDTLRGSMREEDSRTRAAQRAAELRGHLKDEISDAEDKFYVDLNAIPDGWTYEWKRHTIYGEEDPAYQVSLARSGWTAVPVSRHPDMMPHNTDHKIITRDGMILMECPTEIVDERRRNELAKARAQVRHKEQQLAGTPDGTMTRDHAQVKPNIKKSFEAIPVPEK